MAENDTGGHWVILVSFLLAFLLAVFPLPVALQWARPEWVALVLIYWVIALPQRVGIVVAVAAGLMLDLLEGSVLGQNALSLSVVAYLSLLLYQRLRVFNMLQQVAVVFIMIGINQIVSQWVRSLTGVGVGGLQFLLPAVLSALMWPAILTMLRHVRRVYGVS